MLQSVLGLIPDPVSGRILCFLLVAYLSVSGQRYPCKCLVLKRRFIWKRLIHAEHFILLKLPLKELFCGGKSSCGDLPNHVWRGFVKCMHSLWTVNALLCKTLQKSCCKSYPFILVT